MHCGQRCQERISGKALAKTCAMRRRWHGDCDWDYGVGGVDLDLEDGMSSGRFMRPEQEECTGLVTATGRAWSVDGRLGIRKECNAGSAECKKGGLNMVSDRLQIICGDALEVLKTLPGNSVQTCIT